MPMPLEVTMLRRTINNSERKTMSKPSAMTGKCELNGLSLSAPGPRMDSKNGTSPHVGSNATLDGK